MKRILYVGYYDVKDNIDENRNYVMSATNKMSYICSALNRVGYQVEIISASGTKNKQSYPGKCVPVTDNTQLRLFPTMGTGCKLRRAVKHLTMQWHIFWYLFRNTRRNEPLLVYHSLGYVRMIRLLKKLKGFRLILEVEEIYADVTGDERARKREMRLFKAADAYLFPTELLDEKLNAEDKPSVIIYGTYQVEEDRKCSFEDPKLQGKIHCVYAGTFDPRKGGAQAAAAAAEHLPSNYHVHILGFGSEEDKKSMQLQIEKVASKGGATVTYDGLLSGEEYIRFIQSCQIGLSTQMPDAEFNDTSFPSKVLSYLANGLHVVSVRIKALERSVISDLLHYYDGNDPRAIAEAVKSVDMSQPYDSREKIHALDEKFCLEIKELLKQLGEKNKNDR